MTEPERPAPAAVNGPANGPAVAVHDEPRMLPGLRVTRGSPADAAELLVLQRCCWVREALDNQSMEIPALHEDLDEVAAWTRTWLVCCVRQGPRLVGAVRGRLVGTEWDIGRLMVAPDLAGHGLGRWLLSAVERAAPRGTLRYGLVTGAKSARNLALYQRAGYLPGDPAEAPETGVPVATVYLVKPRVAAP